MRKIKVISWGLLIVMILVVITACNFVFSAPVSVRVTAEGVQDDSFDSDVYIFGFTDESARDKARDELLEIAGDSSEDFNDFLYSFNPSGCLDKAAASYVDGNNILSGINISGTVGQLTIRWNTMSPGFGEDYDSVMLYLIAAVEEGGTEYIGTNEWIINSGSSTNQPTVEMKKVGE